MDSLRLNEFEGMPVYFSHKLNEEDKLASRSTRGIVYLGVVYDISFKMKGRPQVPSVHLNPINSTLIGEISLLNNQQQTDCEKAIAERLRIGLDGKISIPLNLVLSNGYNLS